MDKRILIVEDEQNIVDILAFNLQRDGYDTIEAMDGATGLELALEKDPDSLEDILRDGAAKARAAAAPIMEKVRSAVGL